MKFSAYRSLQVVLALVLLTAAGLKGHLLFSGDFADNDLFSSPWLLLALVLFESHWALWLLLGLYPKTTRYVTLIVFAVFAVVSFPQLRSGAASCACFGALHVHPWAAFAFDLGACLALTLCVPSPASVGRVHAAWLRRLAGYGAASAVVLTLIVGFATYSWSRGTYAPPALVCSPATLSLGTVEMAGSTEKSFRLRNEGTTPVHVSRVESGCDCLDILLPQRTVAPRQEVLAKARLDLSREPDFSGLLAVTATGYTESGHRAFRISAEADVVLRSK